MLAFAAERGFDGPFSCQPVPPTLQDNCDFAVATLTALAQRPFGVGDSTGADTPPMPDGSTSK